MHNSNSWLAAFKFATPNTFSKLALFVKIQMLLPAGQLSKIGEC